MNYHTYDRYHINVDVKRLTDSSYLDSLKKQILNETLKDKGLTYHIRFNEYLTEKTSGAFTEHSLERLLAHIAKNK
jgi:hypothetical protein